MNKFNEIVSKLERIEKEQDIKILLAVEAGSRAKGTASIKSDYDVRFIYIQRPEKYLTVGKVKEVIESKMNDVEFCGWGIRKTLNLLKKNNPSLSEWLNSSKTYLPTHPFINEIRSLRNKYFSTKSFIFHYLNMIKSDLKRDNIFENMEIKVKTYINILHSLFSCEWICKFNEPPVVLFDSLFLWSFNKFEIFEDPSKMLLYNTINNLVNLKISGEPGALVVHKEKELNEYIKNKIDYFEEKAKSLIPPPSIKIKELDFIFKLLLRDVYNLEIKIMPNACVECESEDFLQDCNSCGDPICPKCAKISDHDRVYCSACWEEEII